MLCLDGQRCDAPCWGEEDGMSDERIERKIRVLRMIWPREYAVALLDASDTMERLRPAAENAMHTLLHVNADMGERVEVAQALALAIGHPWPPYEGEEEEG